MIVCIRTVGVRIATPEALLAQATTEEDRP
jgi:hypothetical protein